MSASLLERLGFKVILTEACPPNEVLMFARPPVWTERGIAVMGDDGVPRAPAKGEVVRVVFGEPDRLPHIRVAPPDVALSSGR